MNASTASELSEALVEPDLDFVAIGIGDDVWLPLHPAYAKGRRRQNCLGAGLFSRRRRRIRGIGRVARRGLLSPLLFLLLLLGEIPLALRERVVWLCQVDFPSWRVDGSP